MRHKHADMIIAWEEGSQIQYWTRACGQWMDIDNPNWNDDCEFRVKPKEKVAYLDVRYNKSCDDDWDAYDSCSSGFKPSIKVTFGEDNRPIKVELINGTN